MTNPELPENWKKIPIDLKKIVTISNWEDLIWVPHIYPDKTKIKYELQEKSIIDKVKKWLKSLLTDILKDKENPPSYIPSQKADEEKAEELNNYIQDEADTLKWYTPPSNEENPEDKKSPKKPSKNEGETATV